MREARDAGLFPVEACASAGAVDVELLGYRAPVASSVAGVTYRQLDYWARTGIVVPSVRGAVGSGSQRLYSFKDILVLKIVKRLLDAGVSLRNVRLAVDHLHRRGVEELTGTTLLSDGATTKPKPAEPTDELGGSCLCGQIRDTRANARRQPHPLLYYKFVVQ